MPEPDDNLRLEIGHVLFIDIVGYSRLLIEDQKERLNQLTAIVLATTQVREATDEQLVRLPTGDGMALVFHHSVEEAAQCALEIAAALRKHPELPVRMGIHSGPVSAVTDVSGRSNIAGAGINMAQRVMDCGDAGHILLSQRVADDLGQYRQWAPRLQDLGECEVKHGVRLHLVNLYAEPLGNAALPQKFQQAAKAKEPAVVAPVRRSRATLVAIVAAVALVVAATAAYYLTSHRSSASGAGVPGKSIAVLPFADMSQAKDQEYFCDGISEEILDSLAKVDGLRVVARTSAFSFKGKSVDVAEIGQKLGVATVLEGSLRREGNHIRITAQLINATDGVHLWSETFDREFQGVFALQDDITRRIVEALKVKLAVAPATRGQQNAAAYDLYLQGLYYANKSDEPSLRKALTLFEAALEKDPQFARAWTGVAASWNWLADAYVRPLEAYPAAKAAALKALALDPRDADAHVWLGEAKRVLDFDYAGEEAELKQALAIDPNSAAAHMFLALLLGGQGDMTRALEHAEIARKVDPLSAIVSNFAGVILLSAGHTEQAIVEGKRTLELDPQFSYFESALAGAYREQGRLPEAIAIYEKARDVSQQLIPGLAVTYARAGRTADARQILDQCIEQARRGYYAGDAIASIYVALGEPDEAFQWLNRAADEHSAPLEGLAMRPEFRSLHSDPRFAAILRRIGIDPATVVNL